MKKCDIYNSFEPVLACDHSQIIMLYSSYVIQVYFALVFFVKYIVILLANLQQVVQKKKKERTNRI